MKLYDMIKNSTTMTHKGSTVELQQDRGFDCTVDPSQKKSSVASTGIPVDETQVDEAPIDRYPVDNIMERQTVSYTSQ
jgi:hypothetical protein